MKRPRSLGDVQRVLAAIAKTAARLCEANDAVIRLVEGDQVRFVARYGGGVGVAQRQLYRLQRS